MDFKKLKNEITKPAILRTEFWSRASSRNLLQIAFLPNDLSWPKLKKFTFVFKMSKQFTKFKDQRYRSSGKGRRIVITDQLRTEINR